VPDFCNTSFNSFVCSSLLFDQQELLQCTNYELQVLQILCILGVNVRGSGNTVTSIWWAVWTVTRFYMFLFESVR
jgi:hypothetical protein